MIETTECEPDGPLTMTVGKLAVEIPRAEPKVSATRRAARLVRRMRADVTLLGGGVGSADVAIAMAIAGLDVEDRSLRAMVLAEIVGGKGGA